MPKPLQGVALLDYWAALKADKSTNERDRIILTTIARAGYAPEARILAKMCQRGISTRLVEITLAKHADKVTLWSNASAVKPATT